LLEGKKLKEKLAKREQDEKSKQVSKITNTNSEKYIAKKFIKEFDRITQEMFAGLEENPTNLEETTDKVSDIESRRLNYIRYKELLMKLGMITGVAGTPSEIIESNLILELWQLISQSESAEQIAEDVNL
jgi:Fe2+ transport system protein B